MKNNKLKNWVMLIVLLTAFIPFVVHAGAIQLPQTGQTGCWDAGGNAISCAGTGQDGEYQKGAGWPNPRFTDNGNSAVTDNLTGLMWTKSANAPGPTACGPGTTKTWQDALDYVKCLNTNSYLGYNDWHLPNINELRSLANHQVSNVATWLSAVAFDNVPTGSYWSSSFSTWASDRAYAVRLDWNVTPQETIISGSSNVWPVRAGQSGVIQLPRSGQTSCHDASGAVISCTGTGQDGDILAGTAWPKPRFTDNGDGTIKDNLTSLVWAKNANLIKTVDPGFDNDKTAGDGHVTWQHALDYIKKLNQNSYLGYADWRLPNVNEQVSLVNYQENNQSGWLMIYGFTNIWDGGIPPDKPAFYWTSTSDGGNARNKWVNDVWGRSGPLSWDDQNYPYGAVWPVRGPVSLYSLTITKSGTGSGTVTSDTGGISCGLTCSASYNPGAAVILTATPDTGSIFAGWTGGGCSGTGTCTVAINTAQSVTASFILTNATTYVLSVAKSGTGSGTVTSSPAGISCGSTCGYAYNSDTAVTLTAAATSGSTFTGWAGACTGNSTTCPVTMSVAKAVTAIFSSTAVSKPTVITSPTLSITSTAATFSGVVNPNSGATTYYFQYGTTSNYDQNTTSVILAAGTTAQSVQTVVSGLTSNTTYYCRIVAENSAGTSLGGERTFKTLPGANTRTMKAIIVAGGSPSPSNNIWEATKKAADNAYKALIQQGIDKTKIRYLSQSIYDADGDGTSDVHDLATGSNLEYAVTNWASTDTEDVLLYLVDHGTRGYFVIKEGEYVSALDLKSWLDSLQGMITGKVIVIYDACYAGTFIPVLKAPTGQERIVLTSTGMEAQAAFITNGTLSFSNLFWNEIHNGSKFYDAYISAKRSMTYIYQYQMAQIDSNGNGTADEKEDTTLAGSIQIGNEIGTGAPPPTIGSASPTQNISGTSALIYADNVTATAGIQRVWAVVTPPNYSGNSTGAAVTDLPTFDLEKTGATHYEKTYSGFTVSGTYNITIFAMDDSFLVSQPASTQVVTLSSVRLPGDLDGDGAVTVADATIALQVMAGMQPANLRADFTTSGADIDGDGKITQSELLYILQKTAGAR